MTWRKNSLIKFPYNHKRSHTIPKPNTTKGWGKLHKKLYDHIKFHLSVVQTDICAYCRMPIRFLGYGEPIEHIFPKSLNPRWMYHPKNVCLSCYGCNTKKGDQNTRIGGIKKNGKAYHKYPSSSSEYLIIHPHFDTFSKFLVIEDLICKPNPRTTSTKGQETIKMCKLNRLDLLYQRARNTKLNNTGIHAIALNVINDLNSKPEEKKAAQDLITELIKRYKYWAELHKP